MGAWAAAARRTQPGSRWRHPEASQGGVRRAHKGSRRSLVCMLVFHRKKLGPIMLIEHVCACVYDVGSVVSCYSGRALHAGMRVVVWR